jgi:hypothetical protein
VNPSALDPLVDRLSEELQIYMQLRQVRVRANAIGARIPPEVFAGSKPPIGDRLPIPRKAPRKERISKQQTCAAPGCNETFKAGGHKKFCSTACRHAAYEQRQRDAGGSPGTAVGITPGEPAVDDFTPGTVPRNGAAGEAQGEVPFGS